MKTELIGERRAPGEGSMTEAEMRAGRPTWQPIETAPRDGTRFRGRGTEVDHYTGRLLYKKRITWFGKASHVPLYGWCQGRVEDVGLWHPTHWMPLRATPS